MLNLNIYKILSRQEHYEIINKLSFTKQDASGQKRIEGPFVTHKALMFSNMCDKYLWFFYLFSFLEAHDYIFWDNLLP